jgi:hypothetical protein
MSAKSAWNEIPNHLRGGLARYLVHGIQPGGFMSAVLDNDLIGAFSRADLIAARSMREIVAFLYNWAPRSSYGMKGSVDAWLAMPADHRVHAVREVSEDAFEQMVADSGVDLEEAA